MSKKGLFRKYTVAKADGSPVDPAAEYFLLRLDFHDGTELDKVHVNAGREALMVYAREIEPWMPTPAAMFGALDANKEIAQQVKDGWDRVTIEPSMQNLPHPRQVTCNAHFTVTAGEITHH